MSLVCFFLFFLDYLYFMRSFPLWEFLVSPVQLNAPWRNDYISGHRSKKTKKQNIIKLYTVSSGLNGARYVTAGSNMHSHKAQSHCVPNGLKKRGKLENDKKKRRRRQSWDPVWGFRRCTWGVLWRISHVHEVSYILQDERKQEKRHEGIWRWQAVFHEET